MEIFPHRLIHQWIHQWIQVGQAEMLPGDEIPVDLDIILALTGQQNTGDEADYDNCVYPLRNNTSAVLRYLGFNAARAQGFYDAWVEAQGKSGQFPLSLDEYAIECTCDGATMMTDHDWRVQLNAMEFSDLFISWQMHPDVRRVRALSTIERVVTAVALGTRICLGRPSAYLRNGDNRRRRKWQWPSRVDRLPFDNRAAVSTSI